MRATSILSPCGTAGAGVVAVGDGGALSTTVSIGGTTETVVSIGGTTVAVVSVDGEIVEETVGVDVSTVRVSAHTMRPATSSAPIASIASGAREADSGGGWL